MLSATRLTKKTKKVFNIQLIHRAYIFLWIPKNSSLNYLKLYSRGVNWNNRPLHIFGTKDIKHWKKFNWKIVKDFKEWKLNRKYHRYLNAMEHEYIFSKYSWNLIKNIILTIFLSVAWNYLNNCLHICVFMYVSF